LPLLCTIFSASNYSEGSNDGAFLVFLPHPFTDAFPVPNKNSSNNVNNNNNNNSINNNINSNSNNNYVNIINNNINNNNNNNNINNNNNKNTIATTNSCDLYYVVKRYKMSNSGDKKLEELNKQSLYGLILKKKGFIYLFIIII
jgi:hypothetical protein